MDEETFATVSVWSDLGSAAILAIAILIGGLSPSRPIWGRSRIHWLALIASFSAAIIFSAFRFVTEGMFETPGPREFLAGTVVYIGQWVWLYLRMSCRSMKEARLIKVARALRFLQMLRIGNSTDDGIGEGAVDQRRRDDLEVVIREGAREAPKGRPYWRGVMTVCEPKGTIWNDRLDTEQLIWNVTLVQEHLHSDLLDTIGTIAYMSKDEATVDEAYRRFYRVVLTAVVTPDPPQQTPGSAAGTSVPGSVAPATPAVPQLVDVSPMPDPPARQGAAVVPNSQNGVVGSGTVAAQTGTTEAGGPSRSARQGGAVPSREVDFGPFFNKWSGCCVEAVAKRVGATDSTPIGKVARRVAADAIAFVNSDANEFRTEEQVNLINECLAETAMRQFPSSDNSADVVLSMGR